MTKKSSNFPLTPFYQRVTLPTAGGQTKAMNQVLTILHRSRILNSLSDDAQALFTAIADIADMQKTPGVAHCHRDILREEADLSVSAYKASANELEAAHLLSRSTEWSETNCKHWNVFRLLTPVTQPQDKKAKYERLTKSLKALIQATETTSNLIQAWKTQFQPQAASPGLDR